MVTISRESKLYTMLEMWEITNLQSQKIMDENIPYIGISVIIRLVALSIPYLYI